MSFAFTAASTEELTSGSTWHAAGMVTHFHTSPTIMRMRAYSIRLYRSLQAAPGSPEHWHEVGSLRVASSRDQWLWSGGHHTLNVVGVRELPDEPRLAEARLADDRDDLAVTAPGPLQRGG